MTGGIPRTTINFSLKQFLIVVKNLFNGTGKGKEIIGRFEKQFAEFVNAGHAISVYSGKTALSICLDVLGAKKDDRIIVPAFTVSEVIDVIIAKGLRPVFVDADKNTGNIDIRLLKQSIDKETKFILMTHIYGNVCEVEQIREIAESKGITLIEDAAQACGASYKGRQTGNFGKLGYFSFGMLKNLNTLGGGMIVTSDDEYAYRIKESIKGFEPQGRMKIFFLALKSLIIRFFTNRQIFNLLIRPGLKLLGKSREKIVSLLFKAKPVKTADMKTLNRSFLPAQAALGIYQLKMIEKINKLRIDKAAVLTEQLKGLKEIRIIKGSANALNIYLNYVICVEHRAKLADFLFANGIDCGPGFLEACPYIDRFKDYFKKCPYSLELEKHNIYLPIHGLTCEQDMLNLGKLIQKYYETSA